MGSASDPKQRTTSPAYVTVTVRGRDVRVATDAHQPSAEARKSEGTRVLHSIFDSAREMRDRDAERE
jgi:hypothetical protein